MAGWPKPLAGAEHLIGFMSLDVFVLEQIAALSGEIDELRAELRAGKKGAK